MAKTIPMIITEYDPKVIFGVELGDDDKIELSLGPNIPAGSAISSVTIYTDNDGKPDQPLTPSWTSTSGDVTVEHNGETIYKISGNKDGSVDIKDKEKPGADDCYHFGSCVTVDGNETCGDPQMINKPS